MVLSERNEALAELKRLTDRAREEGNTAVERDLEKRGNFARAMYKAQGRNQGDKESLKMGRERWGESWKRKVERRRTWDEDEEYP